MNKKNSKLQIFYQVNTHDGDIKINFDRDGIIYRNDDEYIFETTHKLGDNTSIKCTIYDRKGFKSHVLIKKILLDHQELRNWNTFTTYKLATGELRKNSNGYLDNPGTFQIKIRQNSLASNYISYLYELCKK